MAFRGEQDDVETMQNINTILLQNILPDHVAAHFLDPDRNPAVFLRATSLLLHTLKGFIS